MQGPIKKRKIQSYRLTTILNRSKFSNRKIDFLNIDLEGADLDALKSLDFEIYRPRIICVEIIDEIIEKSKIYIFLKNLNYTKKWSSKFNHIFADNLL